MIIDKLHRSKMPLKIKDDTLYPVEEMRYLGFMLNTRVDPSSHLNKRKTACINRMYSLNNYGLNDANLNPEIKSSLIQQYCYPILFNNIENSILNMNHINELDSCASRMLKRVYHLQKKTRNDELHYACNLTPTLELVKQRKLEFFIRLYENDTTRKMLSVSNAGRFSNRPGSLKRNFLDEIYEICNVSDTLGLSEVRESISRKLCNIENNIIKNRESERSNTLRNLIKTANWANLENELLPDEVKEWQSRKQDELMERLRLI